MATPIANANIQQQMPAQAPEQAQTLPPEFKPSYNAVQLNLSSPTLNAPPAMPPAPPTASKQWMA